MDIQRLQPMTNKFREPQSQWLGRIWKVTRWALIALITAASFSLFSILSMPILPELSAFRGWLNEQTLWLIVPRLVVYAIGVLIAAHFVFGQGWWADTQQRIWIVTMGILAALVFEVGFVQGALKSLVVGFIQ